MAEGEVYPSWVAAADFLAEKPVGLLHSVKSTQGNFKCLVGMDDMPCDIVEALKIC